MRKPTRRFLCSREQSLGSRTALRERRASFRASGRLWNKALAWVFVFLGLIFPGLALAQDNPRAVVLTVIDGLTASERALEGLHALYNSHIRTIAADDNTYEFDERLEFWTMGGRIRANYDGKYIMAKKGVEPKRSETVFDGSVCTELATSEGTGRKPSLTIDKTDRSHIRPRFVLGFDTDDGKSLSEYLRKALDEGRVTRATVRTGHGSSAEDSVLVELVDGAARAAGHPVFWRYVFALTEGLLPVNVRLIQREANGQETVRFEVKRTDLRQVGEGAFVPGKVSRILSFETRVLTLVKAEITVPDETVFQIRPPKGAVIFDRILGVTFNADEDLQLGDVGLKVDKSLKALTRRARAAHSQVGQIDRAKETPATAQKNVARTAKPAERATPRAPAAAPRNAYWLALACGICLALATVGLIARRKR